MRLRFVNILSLSALGIGSSSCRILAHDIDYYFTPDKPVLINFHGYPQTIKQVLFDYGVSSTRFEIRGYEEHGSTTTSFDMQVRNRTDRYHLAIEAFRVAEKQGVITVKKRDMLISKFEKKLAEHREYIMEHGADPQDITDWIWTSRS
jgi:xylulose-5-phosphate/fructose-6-phosphate phosphoketolase